MIVKPDWSRVDINSIGVYLLIFSEHEKEERKYSEIPEQNPCRNKLFNIVIYYENMECGMN